MKNKFLVIIAGPTAVGKSKVALELASDLSCDIFSADSRQIYKEMCIGTAKPSKEELNQVKHHFIDNVSINDHYNVGKYREDAITALTEYFKDSDVAVLVGGTGLYIKALLEGLDDFPDVPSEVSEDIQKQFENEGLFWLQEQVKTLDPAYFSVVDIDNHRRLTRALSIIKSSGKPYSSFLNREKAETLPFQPIEILLELPRDILYKRIDIRVDKMVEAGLVEEAQSLHGRRGLKALETVGYSELFDYFEGKTTQDEAVELIKRNTRRYAKRQMTWFRKFGDWKIFAPDDYNSIIDNILAAISDKKC